MIISWTYEIDINYWWLISILIRFLCCQQIVTVGPKYDFSQFTDLKVPKTKDADMFCLHTGRSITGFSFVEEDDDESDRRQEIVTVSCVQELVNGVKKKPKVKRKGAKLKIRICWRTPSHFIFIF